MDEPRHPPSDPGRGNAAGGPLAAAHASDDMRDTRWLTVPAAFLAAVALLLAADLVADYRSGTAAAHVALEATAMAAGMAGAVILWREARSARRQAARARGDLARAQAEAARWRSEAAQVLQGLRAAIDAQFARWSLTPAEREVGFYLLNGLSLKAIAGLRETSERTVRQQSLAIYRKSGLAGRAELAAFFLEDLIAGPTAPGAAGGEGGS